MCFRAPDERVHVQKFVCENVIHVLWYIFFICNSLVADQSFYHRSRMFRPDVLYEPKQFSFLRHYFNEYIGVFATFAPSHSEMESSVKRLIRPASHLPVKTHLPLNKMPAILTDDHFKCIFMNENATISIWISLKFVLRSPFGNKPELIQVMAWRRTGDKPLPELMLTQFTDA